jgi:cytochrome c-type biogenesis protein
VDGNGVSLSAAFLAGLVSFVSPCVLPLVPVYAAMLTGAGDEERRGRWAIVINTAAFMAGFTLVFIAMGATASLLGQVFLDYQELLRKIGALFIVFMGCHLAGFVRLPVMHREWRPLAAKKLHGPAGSLLLGIAVTTGWTPCIGPILSAVLTYAGMGSTVSSGI